MRKKQKRVRFLEPTQNNRNPLDDSFFFLDPLTKYKKDRARRAKGTLLGKMDAKVFSKMVVKKSARRVDRSRDIISDFLTAGFDDNLEVYGGIGIKNFVEVIDGNFPDANQRAAEAEISPPLVEGLSVTHGRGFEPPKRPETPVARDPPVLSGSQNGGMFSALGDSEDDSFEESGSEGDSDDEKSLADQFWVRNGARLTDALMGLNPFVESSISGTHGEWTCTDDLDNPVVVVSKNIYSGNGESRCSVSPEHLGNIFCKCDNKDHYHPGDEGIRAISKAKRAYLERKRVRDGPQKTASKDKSSPSRLPKMINLQLSKCRDDKCPRPHIHLVGKTSLVVYEPSEGPACNDDEPPLDDRDENDIEMIEIKSGVPLETISSNASTSIRGDDLKYGPKVSVTGSQKVAREEVVEESSCLFPPGSYSFLGRDVENSPSSKDSQTAPIVVLDGVKANSTEEISIPKDRQVRFFELKREDVLSFNTRETCGPLNLVNLYGAKMLVTGLYVQPNDGFDGLKRRQCLLISLSHILQTYGIHSTPSAILSEFPELNVTERGYDSLVGMPGLLQFVERYNATIYFWRPINVGTCKVCCCCPLGLGPRVFNIMASPGHFEAIHGVQMARVPEPGGFVDLTRTHIHCSIDDVDELNFESCITSRATTLFGYMRSQEAYFCVIGDKNKSLFRRHDCASFDDDFLPGEASNAYQQYSSGLEDIVMCDFEVDSLIPNQSVGRQMCEIQSRYLTSVEETMSANGCRIPDHVVPQLSPRATLSCVADLVVSGDSSSVLNPLHATIPVMLRETEKLFKMTSKVTVFKHKDDAFLARIHVDGTYFDSIKEVDIFSKVGKIVNNDPSLLQSIKDWCESLVWTNTGYTFTPMGNQVKLGIDIKTTYEIQPTFFHRLITLNFAKNSTRNRPNAKVDLVSGAYTSKYRGIIFWDLADNLFREGYSIGSLASGEFWTWSVNKYREAARRSNPDYFSIQNCVSLKNDGVDECCFNSVTVNTICYVIGRMLLDSSVYNVSTPIRIPTDMCGKSNWTSKIFGGADTFMGVMRARKLMEDGVATGKGLLCKGPGYSIIESHPPMQPGVYDFGLCRMLPSLCKKKMDWKFNDKFKIISGSEHITPDGYIEFSADPDEALFDTMGYSHRYSTIYGYAFGHSGVIYGKNNANIAHMVERHWKTRLAEPNEVTALAKFGIDATVDFEINLLTNQRIFAHHYAADFCRATIRSYGLFEYFTYTQEAADLLILEKHPKQLLRLDAHGQLVMSGDIGKKLFVPYLVWKVKEMEIAKFGKPPRVVVDAQTGNSLPSVHISNAWKKLSADKVVVYNECVSIEFVSSPSSESLCNVFKSWDDYTYPVVIKNYSDDSIVGIWSKTLGRYACYNTDIRANDGSHTGWTWSVFANLLGMTDEHRDFLNGMIFAKNYILSRNKKERITFIAKYGYLPSGIGETSIANNTAMLMMAYIFSVKIKERYPLDVDTFTYSAYLCGFLLTFEEFDLTTTFSRMQFLKNSPCRLPDGNLVSIPNLGRILRYSGRSKSDITPKMFPPPFGLNLFKWYQTLLTYGDFRRVYYKPLALYLCPYYSYVDSRHYNSILTLRDDLVHQDLEGQSFVVTRDVYYSRYLAYGCTYEDILEFESFVSKSNLGSIIYCKMVDTVLFRDYGLAPLTI